MSDRGIFWRMVLVIVLVTAAWAGLGTRLAFLHLGENQTLRENVQKMRRMEKQIFVGRGRIFDVNGNILALDIATKDVIADPKVILEKGQMDAVGSVLSRVLDVDPAFVRDRLSRPKRRYMAIKRYTHAEEFERIQRMRLPGVYMEDSSARYYPHGELAGHLIGFSNVEGVGSAGIEMVCDKYLKGHPGRIVSLKDGRRREIYQHRTVEVAPQEGGSVYLTIDMAVQHMVEESLRKAVETNDAAGAWAVVQEVKTGRILAMASVPSYDPNQYRTTPQERMMNRVTGYTYEPGSTMKALAFAAAFNEGIVTTNEVIDCHWGTWFYLGRPLRDYHGYDRLTVADVLKKSSNIGTAKITLRLGEERLDGYLREFGLGRSTQVGLQGEEPGIVAPRSRWDKLSITRFPIGHGIAVTAMQMVNMYSAIANGGYLMKPYLVERIVDAKGRVVMEAKPEMVGRPIREDTSILMRQLLKRVTEDGGTARRARIEGYDIAGKTGTAEKIVDGRYSHSKNIASFAGFFPAMNPDICMIVVVDEPKRAHTGGVVAGPVFGEIAEQIVRCLHIPPTGRDDYELESPWVPPTSSTGQVLAYDVP